MTLCQWVRILIPKTDAGEGPTFVWNVGNKTGSDAVLLKNVVQYGGSSFHSLLYVAVGAFISPLARPEL